MQVKIYSVIHRCTVYKLLSIIFIHLSIKVNEEYDRISYTDKMFYYDCCERRMKRILILLLCTYFKVSILSFLTIPCFFAFLSTRLYFSFLYLHFLRPNSVYQGSKILFHALYVLIYSVEFF